MTEVINNNASTKDRYDEYMDAKRAKEREYYHTHKDIRYKYVKKDKNQCAYVGPVKGRCARTTFKEYCSIHKGGKLCTKVRKVQPQSPLK